MVTRLPVRAVARAAAAAAAPCCIRSFASTSRARAISEFAMPSMSPTMESGKISSWKVKQGDKFSAGDVLLTVETDKAEVDVEAQDDGVMGKIIYDEKESSITVGKTIALLAEEGDDISNLSIPESASPSSSKSQPESTSSSGTSSSTSSSKDSKSQPPAAAQEKTSSPSSSPVKASDSVTTSEHGLGHEHYSHPRGLLPSVVRLLTEGNVSPTDVEKIPTTGRRGQLTKSDVLLYLGTISSEVGLEKYLKWSHAKMEIYQTPSDRSPSSGGAKGGKEEEKRILSGDEFRRFILKGLSKGPESPAAQKIEKEISKSYGFEDILEGYLPKKLDGVTTRVDPGLVNAAKRGQKDSFSEVLGL